MAQVCVVNCFSCEVFQGQQVKKGNKWTCKMCGEKQSFKKIFAQGIGKECRQVVQKLNMIRGNLKLQMLEENYVEEHSNETTVKNKYDDQENEDFLATNQTTESKWNQFISSNTTVTEESEDNANEEFYTQTERTQFNNYNAQKRKKPMKDEKSDNFQRRKATKFDPCKTTYPESKTSSRRETPLGKLDHEISDVVLPRFSAWSPENETNCFNEISPHEPAQSLISKEIFGPTKFSKWSKYNL